MERCLQPELLDELPAGDPRARRARGDLRRLNACMGNARLMAACLAEAVRRAPPRRIVDLGTGDGTFLLRLTERLPRLAPGTELVLANRVKVVDDGVLTELRHRGFNPRFEQADAWDWLRATPQPARTWAVSNLFLHHFTAEELRAAFAVLTRTSELCCACEPRRAAWSLLVSRLLWLIGAHAVTRHDAVVSVRAGFAGRELSCLWPADRAWNLGEQRAGLFSHLFLAERTSGGSPVPP